MKPNLGPRIAGVAVALSCAMIMAASAWAQTRTSGPGGFSLQTILGGMASTLVFGIMGIVLAIIGFKLFDAAISFNIEREICENKNVAAAILAASVVLGISIIIAVAVL